MQVSRLTLNNYRNIKHATLEFDGHTLLVGANNVGKSTVCEALELALGPDRQGRVPVVEEFDFYNAAYLDGEGKPIEIRIEVLLTDVTPTIINLCAMHLERWDPEKRRILAEGEIDSVDDPGFVWCLRLLTIARYNKEEDEFEAATHYAKEYAADNEESSLVRRNTKRNFGFLYLRTLRTGSRALSLERGSLLDVILRIQSLRTGIWEKVRTRLETLAPPIEEGASDLTPVLRAIESRLAEYITLATPGSATKLFVSQLTREHLRKTLSFFISIADDQKPVPFQHVGTGTLNTLVLALLSFIAELKEENVIFAMEEPEIALPPHTQRRISTYLLTKTTQCFVTSHSPYVMEMFDPQQVVILRRSKQAIVTGTKLPIGAGVKLKTYRRYVRRGFAEAMLGRGVVVTEGMTEQLVLRSVAEKLEAADSKRYPLDLSGVTIISADGDGSIAEFGRFFVSLDLPTFAFFDNKARNEKDRKSLNEAGFTILKECSHLGMEALLAAEVPVVRQWAYLVEVGGTGAGQAVATKPPPDKEVRELTLQFLKDGKGWGRAAGLIERCDTQELPASVVAFLEEIYLLFPRPKALDLDEQTAEKPPDPATPAASEPTPDAPPTAGS
jgi:putative ATP-dependent endonuclease of the OLD family